MLFFVKNWKKNFWYSFIWGEEGDKIGKKTIINNIEEWEIYKDDRYLIFHQKKRWGVK